MLAVLPSCRKNSRCPAPHSGALRNSSEPAAPWGTRSASAPMLWIAMSENGLYVTLLSGANGDGPVVSDGVWQSAQPTLLKTARPFVVEGVAGKRMKAANSTASLDTAAGSPASIPSLLVWSSGEPLNTQPATAERSLV